jgi:hypothetical protein
VKVFVNSNTNEHEEQKNIVNIAKKTFKSEKRCNQHQTLLSIAKNVVNSSVNAHEERTTL